MSRELRRGDIAEEEVEAAIICGEMKEPAGGVALNAESRALVEPVLRWRSERLRVTMLWGFRDEMPGVERPLAVTRSGWLMSERELVRWLAREGLRGREPECGRGYERPEDCRFWGSISSSSSVMVGE
jgi:hypothetical protein